MNNLDNYPCKCGILYGFHFSTKGPAVTMYRVRSNSINDDYQEWDICNPETGIHYRYNVKPGQLPCIKYVPDNLKYLEYLYDKSH